MLRNYILDERTVKLKLERIAYEIYENNSEEESLLLVGIRDNGSTIAEAVQQLLTSICTLKTELIHLSLDKRNPREITLSQNLPFNDRVIIVIDDVANSGKTMLYAMKPFLQQHPRKIQTLALVERTHKKFPVHNDYVGLSVATTLQEHIYVEVSGNVVKGAYLE